MQATPESLQVKLPWRKAGPLKLSLRISGFEPVGCPSKLSLFLCKTGFQGGKGGVWEGCSTRAPHLQENEPPKAPTVDLSLGS